jgi:hypothetical protein
MGVPNRLNILCRNNLINSKRLIIHISLVFIFVSFAIVYWAEFYPVVWRKEMLADAPNSWLFFSVIAPILLLYLFNRRFYIFWGETRNWNTTAALYLLFGLPLLLIFNRVPVIVNGWLDTTPSQNHCCLVADKKCVTTRGFTSYFLLLQDWKNPSQQIKLSVPQQFFASKKIGDNINVTAKRGFLDCEWVVDFR